MTRIMANARAALEGTPVWFIAGEAVNRGGRFVLLLLIAREVGAADFGSWVIAVTTGTILANAADAGLIMATTTHIASDKSQTRRHVANIWGASPLLGIMAFGLLGALSPLLATGTSLFLLLTLGLGGILENTAVLLLTPLRAHERFSPEGLLRSAQGSLLLIGGTTLVLTMGASEAAIGPLFLIVGLASVAFAAITSIRAFGTVRPELDLAFLRTLIASALPAFGATIAFFLYFRIDAYMLAFINGEQATGLYGAAYSFTFGASFVPLFFGRAMLSRFASSPAQALRDVYAKAALTMGVLAILLSAVLIIATPVFVGLYGDDFSDARTAYFVLVVAQAVYFFTHLNTMVLFGRRRAGTAWGLTLLALAINVGANLLLIPPLGASGAALAMVTSEAILLSAQAPFLARLLLGRTAAPARRAIERNREVSSKAA